jgi:hypothetical protein
MFDGAKLKVERANHHISDLETQFAAFVDSHPYAMAVSNDADTGQTILRLNLRKPIPTEWALIIGDAIHNLHSALDHMTWELIGHDGGTQDRYIKFPTGDDKASFDGTCNGIKTPSQSLKDILKATEAFPEGKGDSLHDLHHLDIADKHAILLPVVRAARVSKIVIYNGDGKPHSTFLDTTFIMGGSSPSMPITGIPSGGYVELDKEALVTPEIVLGKINADGGWQPVFGKFPPESVEYYRCD